MPRSRASTCLLPALVLLALAGPGRRPAAAEERAQTVFRAARAYTVRIQTEIATPFLEDEKGSFEGAGFLVDAERGWILTNAHVAALSPSTVRVAFADGEYQPARKVYVDPFTDVAVLEVQLDRRHRVAPLDCQRLPEVGQGVGAFGHPLGMPFTGSRGIVSGRTDQMANDLIQIDATVDHGNSGGPVISMSDGRVVGIATAMVEGSKSDRLNFATPMADVCRILDLLRHDVPPDPALLEFALLVDEDGRHTLEVGATYDAARWPFQPGDRIVAVGAERTPVRTLTGLFTALRGRPRVVPIRVVRGGSEIEIQAEPARWTPVTARRAVSVDGAVIAPMEIEDAVTMRDPAGLVVQSVEPGSPAETANLQTMDIIRTIDGRAFEDLDSLIGYLRSRPQDSPLRVVFCRSSKRGDRWMDYHVRELPGEETKAIPEESPLVGREP